ncbi:MAG TPA: PilT/PilU family type 4a pilus ATPase [Pirellulales bacterium]|jgi:twitching motility protein PilT|nr:PilT/PilU family type 4a pilus ATPase [Pirellulales bacterium]
MTKTAILDDTAQTARDYLERLLADCTRLDASDLHLAVDLAPYFRIHGVLDQHTHYGTVSAEQLEGFAVELARASRLPPLGASGSLDGALTAADGTRFRFNVFRRQGRVSVALRRLEDRFRALADLGLPDSLYDLCDLPDGLVLVAGPTGAGKSTTLATLIDRINRTRPCHIVTIEDPIEYLHAPLMSLVNQRQLGLDTDSFNEALVASMRQDPDVILVGEIRDLATIRTAITAAETGHLVFTTVHAGDCVGTIERLVSVFPADEQLGVRRQVALVLKAIVAQHLIVADGPANRPSENGQPANPRRRTRVVTSEVLIANPAVANLIATGKSNQIYSSMETGGNQGMQTLEEDLARLLAAHQISETTAMTMARNPQIVRDRMAMWQQNGTAAHLRRSVR